MISRGTILTLTIYAVAMALLESAVVVYLRRLYYPENPLEIFPMQFLDTYDVVVELSREIATVVMLVTVAILAGGSTHTRRFAAFVFMFGVWDIFYYVWLKVLMDWPQTWLEWDVLFLIPLVWLGPWICPVLISLLFVAWGYRTMRPTHDIALAGRCLAVFTLGAGLGLLAFFQPAISVIMRGGTDALTSYTPGGFWWWLFVLSYLLMACGLGMAVARASTATRKIADPNY